MKKLSAEQIAHLRKVGKKVTYVPSGKLIKPRGLNAKAVFVRT